MNPYRSSGVEIADIIIVRDFECRRKEWFRERLKMSEGIIVSPNNSFECNIPQKLSETERGRKDCRNCKKPEIFTRESTKLSTGLKAVLVYVYNAKVPEACRVKLPS